MAEPGGCGRGWSRMRGEVLSRLSQGKNSGLSSTSPRSGTGYAVTRVPKANLLMSSKQEKLLGRFCYQRREVKFSCFRLTFKARVHSAHLPKDVCPIHAQRTVCSDKFRPPYPKGMLAGTVPAGKGHRRNPRNAVHSDNLPLFPLYHVRQNTLGQGHGPYVVQIHQLLEDIQVSFEN